MPTASPLYHLVYQSSSTTFMTERELEQILTKARTANTANNLTGVLLYSNGDIMQVLEGEQQTVIRVYEKIKRDIRHRDVITLADGNIQQRNFSQWSMGFRAIDPANFTHLTGYLNVSKPHYLNGHITTNDSPLQELLSTFIQDEMIRL